MNYRLLWVRIIATTAILMLMAQLAGQGIQSARQLTQLPEPIVSRLETLRR